MHRVWDMRRILPAALEGLDMSDDFIFESYGSAGSVFFKRRRSLHERDAWGVAGIEPSLCEALADPLVHAVMRRDGVTRDELVAVIRAAQSRLHDTISPCLAA
jgi:hypothetical protein